MFKLVWSVIYILFLNLIFRKFYFRNFEKVAVFVVHAFFEHIFLSKNLPYKFWKSGLSLYPLDPIEHDATEYPLSWVYVHGTKAKLSFAWTNRSHRKIPTWVFGFSQDDLAIYHALFSRKNKILQGKIRFILRFISLFVYTTYIHNLRSKAYKVRCTIYY